MKMKFLSATLVIAAILLFQLPVAGAVAITEGFSDVSSSHPNYAAIMALKDRGIIGGYPDGTFKPEQAVNRVEALKIILLGSNVYVPDANGTAGFKDTDANAWYAKFILKAQLLAIVQGYPDGSFKPEQTVNLAENLKILLLTNKTDLSKVSANEDPYADVLKTEWYAVYAQYAKDHKLIDADSMNKIYPAQGMTRAKLAETIYRLAYLNEHGLETFTPPQVQTQNETYMEVSISDFAYTPSEMTIGTGFKVRWTNKDNTAHTIVSDDNTFESTTLGQDESFSYTFDKTGVYKYHCSIHPYMTGTITVKPANEVPTI